MELKDRLHQRLSALLCTPEERALKGQHLTPENGEKILALKNKYAGKRCFIVGSSPSLNLLDLTKLNNEYTFTVNRGYMLKEKGLEHSTFHVISDRKTFEDKNSRWEEMENFSDNLFCYAGMEKPPVHTNTIYFDYKHAQLLGKPFQENLLEPLAAYESVIHFAIQIAYYLGFSEIYILGVDLDFTKTSGHAYQETDGETKRQLEHSIKSAQMMIKGIGLCGKFLDNHDVWLYNASPQGVVDCIKRVKYEELFHD